MKGNIEKSDFDKLWTTFTYSAKKSKKSFRPRGAVIPWTVWNDRIWYFFGIDNQFKSICDFGGGLEPSDGSLTKTALREWAEESLEVFKPYVRESAAEQTEYFFDIYKPKKYYPSPHLILFLPLRPINPRIIREQFLDKTGKDSSFLEVIDIIAIEKNILCDSIKQMQTERRFFITKTEGIVYKLWDQLFWRLYEVIHTTSIFDE
jgi:hypothetical protein